MIYLNLRLRLEQKESRREKGEAAWRKRAICPPTNAWPNAVTVLSAVRGGGRRRIVGGLGGVGWVRARSSPGEGTRYGSR